MIPDPYTPIDLLPIAFVVGFVAALIIAGTWIAEWADEGRPSALLALLDPIRARFRAWFDRVVPVEQYPGQYDAALAPELIAKRDRTWAEADEFWDDDKFWASIADAIHELERKGDVA